MLEEMLKAIARSEESNRAKIIEIRMHPSTLDEFITDEQARGRYVGINYKELYEAGDLTLRGIPVVKDENTWKWEIIHE